MAQSFPSDVAMIVAALGMLYMSASSPKLPWSTYSPTFSPATRMSYLPLHSQLTVVSHHLIITYRQFCDYRHLMSKHFC